MYLIFPILQMRIVLLFNSVLICYLNKDEKNYLFLMFLSVSVFAQKSINNYKYIVVPKQMETFDEPNKHETSSLTKFLFNKNGFNAFFE